MGTNTIENITENIIKQKEYIFSNDVGDAIVTVYDVFPGVQLAYNSVHMDQMDLNTALEGKFIEIHHCREGRIEQEVEGEYFYLMPGDLSIAIRTRMADTYEFPLSHYHGITIGINMDVISTAFWRLLEEMQVQPMEVARSLCGDRNCHIIRGEKYVEHIFSELYSVPESIKAGYFKVKIMELFLVLGGKNLQKEHVSVSTLPKSQVRLAHQAAAYLAERMDQHVTIEELAKQFNVSTTHLKSVFKGVYGVPIFSYMRIQRMQSATQLLIHTDKPIAEIAYEFGYSNTSKFASAFQKIIGDTPSEYRKEHTKYHLV